MRTTVTLDADTEALLREEVARTGESFKRVLNGAVRRALAPRGEPVGVRPLFPARFPLGLGGESLNRAGDDWDDEETLEELGR